eukprot:SAG22_NODE_1312_length_4776_cov_2.886466_5_plen_223_part_00
MVARFLRVDAADDRGCPPQSSLPPQYSPHIYCALHISCVSDQQLSAVGGTTIFEPHEACCPPAGAQACPHSLGHRSDPCPPRQAAAARCSRTPNSQNPSSAEAYSAIRACRRASSAWTGRPGRARCSRAAPRQGRYCQFAATLSAQAAVFNRNGEAGSANASVHGQPWHWRLALSTSISRFDIHSSTSIVSTTSSLEAGRTAWKGIVLDRITVEAQHKDSAL